MSEKTKGVIGELPLLMLIGLIAMISAILFLLFFKVHITSIAVDVNSINRYQEIPTTILANSVFVEDLIKLEKFGKGNPDDRPKEKINCFQGDGPDGAHTQVNEKVCTKRLAFFYSKNASEVGFFPEGESSSGTLNLKNFKENLLTSLPFDCFNINFRAEGKYEYKLEPAQIGIDCNLGLPKLNQIYPIPIFISAPEVAEQVLVIGNSFTQGEELLVTWPRYVTDFRYGGGTP